MKKIVLVTTGGTIDKVYAEGLGAQNFVFLGNPAAASYLGSLGYIWITHHNPFTMDSLEMTDGDRAVITEYCLHAKHPVIITHGTDTMVETGRFIQEKLGPDHDKTIVLTGALRPAVQSDTDAFFNLGFALATCFTAPPGVYIAMHGIHDPRHCRKTETGIFMPSYH